MLPSLNHLSLPSNWQHVHLADTDSTMLQLQRPTYTHSTKEFVLMTTDYQTAGHGQKGTSWEAERGENLLFSFVFHPTLIPALQQFALSEALALGIRAALLSFVGEGITVKWPNDIYWQDKKIAGDAPHPHALRCDDCYHTHGSRAQRQPTHFHQQCLQHLMAWYVLAYDLT